MKTIAALLVSDKIGGAELVFKNTCKLLQPSKIIINLTISEQLDIDNSVPLKFAAINRKLTSIIAFSFFYPFIIVKLLIELKGIKHIYVNDFQGLVYIAILKFIRGNLKVYYHCHTAFRFSSFNKLLLSKFVNRVSNVVIVPSHYLKNELGLLGINRIICIYNGITGSDLINQKRSDRIGLNGIFKIGIFGALNEQKGQDLLVKAIKALRKRNIPVQGHIAGYTLDDDFEVQLKNEVDLINLTSEGIVFHGELVHERAISLMNECAIIVCASRYRETFPTVLLEAMSLKIPVVGTRVGGIPEIIDSGKNGLLIEPNEQELEKAIEKIIAENLFEMYGHNGFDKFQAFFSIDIFEKKIKELFNV